MSATGTEREHPGSGQVHGPAHHCQVQWGTRRWVIPRERAPLTGRTVSGRLKGYDALVNIVLDEAVEYLETPKGTTTREFGLLVCKGTAVMVVHPDLGTEEIANPWAEPDN